MQDLITSPKQTSYTIEPVSPSSYTVNIGDTIVPPEARLTANGAAVDVRFDADVSSGTAVQKLADGRLFVAGPGDAVVRVMPRSTGITSDTALHIEFTLHGAVPRLASGGPDTLYSINDTLQLVATPVTRTNAPITATIPVTWSLQSGGANVQLLDAATGRIRALGNGDAILMATSDTATLTKTVYVRQRATTTTSLGSPLTLHAASQQRQLGTQARDARLNAVSGGSYTWTSRDAAVVTVSATGLVQAVAAGSTRVVVTATGPGGATASARDSITVTVAPARLRAEGGNWFETASIGTLLPAPFVVQLVDAQNNLVRDSGIAVTFEVFAGDGAFGGQASTTVRTDTLGRAQAGMTLGLNLDEDSARATGQGLVGSPVVFGARPAHPRRVTFEQEPSNTVAGALVQPAPRVAVRDTFGTVVTTTSGFVTVRIQPGTGTAGAQLLGDSTGTLSAGLATFANLTPDRVGTGYRLIAAFGTCCVPDTSQLFNVTSGAAAKLAFTVQPASGFAAQVMSPAIQVAVQDAFGNLVTSFVGDVTISVGTVPLNGSSQLFGTTQVAVSNGVASFTDLVIQQPASGYRLRAAAAGLPSLLSQYFDLRGAPANILAVSGNNQNGLVGTALSPFVVKVTDAGGTGVPGDSVIFKVTAGGGKLSGQDSLVVLTDASGQASATLTLGSSPGTSTVTARSKSIAATTLTFSASATAPDLHLTFLRQPSNATGGAAISPAVEVAVQDASNNTVTTATTIVTLAIAAGTGSSGATLGGTVQVAAVNGVAVFGGVSLDRIGNGYQLTASANGVTAATSTTFNVTLGPASKVGFIVQPAGGSAGAALPGFQVAVQDAGGNTVNSCAGTIGLSILSGTGTPGANMRGTVVASPTNCVASYTDFSIDSASQTSYRLVAILSGLAADTSAPFLIVPAPASRLAFSVQPSSVTAGVAIAPAVVVLVQDSLGNTVTSATNGVNITTYYNPGFAAGGTIYGTTAVSATAGLATFSNLRLNRAATGYTLVARASGLTEVVSTSFNVTPAPPTRLSFTVQPTDAAPAATISPAVQVSVLDSLGNVVTNATTTVTVQITGGTGTGGASLAGTTQVSAVAGVATFSNLSISTVGNNYTLTASASGGIQSAVSAPLSILTAASNRLVFTLNPSAGVVAGSDIAPGSSIKVAVQDGSGNTVTSFTGNVTVGITLGTGTAGANLRGTKTVAAASGVATFTGLSVDSAGSGYTLTAGASGVASGTSLAFLVSPAPPSQLSYLVQPSSRTAGSVFSPAVQVAVLDSMGNRTIGAATTSVTLAVTSGTGTTGAALAGTTTQSTTSGTGVATFADLHIDQAGSGYTLTATASGTTSAVSSSFSITAGPAVVVTVTPSSATIVSLGGTQQLTTPGAVDAFGNVVSSAVTWSSLNSNVATVNSNGLVTVVGSGQVAIAASAGGVTGYTLVTAVVDGPAPSLWVQTSTTKRLHGVWGTSGSNVFAVGLSGAILRWNGSEWTSQASGTDQDLNGVWGTSPTNVYVVGNGGTILRWDGTGWRTETSGTSQQLNRAWGTSPTNVFATGTNGILRWDGANWTAVAGTAGQYFVGVWGTSPANAYAMGEIGAAAIVHYDGSTWTTQVAGSGMLGVWGTSLTNAYAVGYSGTILRWDGSSWGSIASGTGQYLTGVWGTSPTNVFAVGFGGVILRYDGTSWISLVSLTTQNIQSVWASPGGDVWAVSDSGTILRGYVGATVIVTPATSTLTALGATQQLTATAKDASNSTVSGVTFTWSSNNTAVATVDASTGLVTAVGNGNATITATAPGGAAGSTTVTVSQVASTITVSPAGASLASQGGTTTLTATAKDANGNTISGATFTWVSLNTNVATVNSSTGVVTAVASGQVTISATSGSATGYALVTVAIPGATPVNLWAPMTSGTTQFLRGGVWGSSASNVFAVGESGTILRYTGTVWSAMTSGTNQALRGVWGSSATDVYAVGDGGLIRFNGTSWSPILSGTTGTLTALGGVSPSDVYAMDVVSGTILRFSGASWSVMTSGTTQLLGIWGASRTEVYAVGDGGTIMRFDGTGWASMTSGTVRQLVGTWGASSGDVFAVGEAGTILRFDGTNWSPMVSQTSMNLAGVWGTSTGDVYATGGNGTILRFNGTTWTSMPSGTTEYLRGVWGTSLGDIYAVGTSGTILRGVRGATVTLEPGSYTLTALGATAQLTATAKDASSATVSGVTFTWSSNNTTVVTVDASTGVVTAVSNGTATISATAPGGAAGSTTVTVSQVASTVTVSPAGASLASQGGTTTLTATAKDANGNTISGATFTWASLNTNVATVNSSTGVVTAVASGQVTISATSGSATGYALVTVAIPGATPVNLWAPMTSGTAEYIYAVWAASAPDVYAVAPTLPGQVLHFDGNNWSSINTGTSGAYQGVWGTSPSNIFVVGSAGAIARFDGTTWTAMPSGTTNDLRNVWAASPTQAFGVGASGTIVRFEGGAWSAMTSGTGQYLSDVWGSSSSDVFVVGQNGTILHFDGTSWSGMASGTGLHLYTVWGTSASNVYAAGLDGVILRYNGTSWSTFTNGAPTGANNQVIGMSGTSSNDIYGAGDLGHILRFDGSSWSLQGSGTTQQLDDVATQQGGSVFTVGIGGTMLRGVRGATVTVTPGSSTLLVPTQTVQLTATARDAQSNVVSGLSNSSYTWSTSNASAATVSSSGLVTMQGLGTATITATAPGGAAGTATVSTGP